MYPTHGREGVACDPGGLHHSSSPFTPSLPPLPCHPEASHHTAAPDPAAARPLGSVAVQRPSQPCPIMPFHDSSLSRPAPVPPFPSVLSSQELSLGSGTDARTPRAAPALTSTPPAATLPGAGREADWSQQLPCWLCSALHRADGDQSVILVAEGGNLRCDKALPSSLFPLRARPRPCKKLSSAAQVLRSRLI